ncbi:DUF5719 family protein [Cellulomonas rhizosphaerae]|uniref:Large extracellular alpha-helical protein n=1 Tax=Cellulomonas rhizosphaerae TaxID=2293719 RepID=A0A413RK83_9CELL|nr:DUF5719 family protein [Cellulomonas rhizosphaerae]RHA39362.1 hypothetical protein D1825_11875 [Cellulomonas rhizosphaerae]
MSARRTVWLGRAVRAVSGLGVVALVAVIVAGGVRLPEQDVAAPADGTVVDVPPGTVTLTCPGPLILPESSGDKAFDPTPVAPAIALLAAAASSAGGSVAPAAGGDAVATLAAGSAAALVTPAVPLVVRAEPTEAVARVAGAVGSIVTAGDLRGLSAASCQRATTDAWLVGGATDLSSTAQLVISAAGSTPAEVTVAVYGPSGKVDLSASHYLVAPGAQRVVVLGAVAPEQRRVAVRVTATGGAVTAYIQDSVLDGFTPRGTDLVVPGSAPAKHVVVPGLSVIAAGVDSPLSGALRLMVTGKKATTAHIRLLGARGEEDLPGAQEIELEPGEVTDVPLGGLPAGAYTAVIDADLAVVASGLVTRAGAATAVDPAPSMERAWVASAAPGVSGIAAVPAGTRGMLVATAVGGAGDATGTLRAIGDDGRILAERTVTVPAGTTGSWFADTLVGTGPVVPGKQGTATPGVRVAALELVPDDGGARLAWALVADVGRPDGTLISVLSPVPADPASTAVTVRQDPRVGTR